MLSIRSLANKIETFYVIVNIYLIGIREKAHMSNLTSGINSHAID
jgi:hypothetical protein